MRHRTPGAFQGSSRLFQPGTVSQLRLTWRLLRDERVNPLKYVLPAIIMLYLISPMDGIPDFLIGPGQVDDVGFVVGAVLLLARVLPWLAPRDVVDEHVMDLAGVRVERDDRTAEQAVEARFTVSAS